MTNPIAPNDQLNALLNAFIIEAGGTTNPYVQAIVDAIAATPSLTNPLNNEAAAVALIGIHHKPGGNVAWFSESTTAPTARPRPGAPSPQKTAPPTAAPTAR
jgi:hypothetical protein